MPSLTNIPAHYRLHADRLANDELPRPIRAVLVEFDAEGRPQVYTFGMASLGKRETIGVLTDVIKALNAESSN